MKIIIWLCTMFTRNHKEKLEDVNDTLREAMEIAREEDSDRDVEMRKLLKSAIQTIDVVTGGFYEGHYDALLTDFEDNY